MGISPRLAVAFAVVLLLPALAGCNVKDWYNQQGNIKVFLQPQGPTNSSLTEFRTLTLAVYGVTVKQLLILDRKEFTFGEQPLLVDMVATGVKGERTLLATAHMNIRPVESVTIRVDVLEAVDAQGRTVPVCREGQPAPSFPCFFLGSDGAIIFDDRNVPIPRGGTVDFGFPLAVKTATQGGRQEYFLLSDPALATVQNE